MRYEATVRSLDDVDYGEDFVTVSTLGQAIMAYYQAPTLKTAPRVPAFSFCVAPTLSVWGSSLERQASLLPTVCRSCWR